MINDLKTALKVFKYGYPARPLHYLTMILIVIDVLVTIFYKPMLFFDIVAFVGAVLYHQYIYSLDVSNMVGASPYKKKFQTSICTLLEGAVFLATYILLYVSKIISIYLLNHEDDGSIIFISIFALAICILNILSPITYKFYSIYIGLIAASFIITFIALTIFNEGGEDEFAIGVKLYTLMEINPLIWLIMVVAVLIISSVLQYVMSILVYKRDISRLAFHHLYQSNT